MEILYIILSVAFFVSALNSAPNALPFVFISALFTPLGWILTLPLFRFIRGRRWRTSLIKRKWKHKNLNLSITFQFRNIFNVPKLLAFYLYTSIMPTRLAFFYAWGVQRNYLKPLVLLICCIFCLQIFYIGLQVDYKLTLWWFLAILPFTHIFGVKGQYCCDRYLLLANVAFCVLMSKLLHGNYFIVVCTLYFCLSLKYIPAWRHNEPLFRYGMNSQPEAPENYNNLARFMMEKRDYGAGVRPLQVAEILTSGNKFTVYCNMATCYEKTRHYFKALLYWKKAIDNNCPNNERENIQEHITLLQNKIITIKKNEKKLRKAGVIT